MIRPNIHPDKSATFFATIYTKMVEEQLRLPRQFCQTAAVSLFAQSAADIGGDKSLLIIVGHVVIGTCV